MKLHRLKWLCARVTPRRVHAAVVPAWFAAVLSTTQTTRQAAERARQHLQHGVPHKRAKLQRVPPGAMWALSPQPQCNVIRQRARRQAKSLAANTPQQCLCSSAPGFTCGWHQMAAQACRGGATAAATPQAAAPLRSGAQLGA